jgi:hypothetical protein
MPVGTSIEKANSIAAKVEEVINFTGTFFTQAIEETSNKTLNPITMAL